MQNQPTKQAGIDDNGRPTNRGQDATLCVRHTQFDLKEAVENALILYAELPAIQVADHVAQEALTNPVFVAETVRISCLRAVKVARRKQSDAKNEQYRLRGYELLPLRIRGARKKERDLIKSTYYGVRVWVQNISGSHIRRKRNDPKLKQAKKLCEIMRAASKRHRGITVGEVLGLSPARAL